MTATTDLKQQRKSENLQTNITATQGQSLTPNQGSVVPSVIQTQSLIEQARAAYNGIPNINPPSEEEIQHQMWMTSGIMGLVAALVTGNAAGGIAAGMTAALAVHDHGYDLRQRGEYIMELHSKGFSTPAILNWYKTGDNKELDKEGEQMQRLADSELNRQEREEDRDQRADFHKDQMEQGRLAREQSAVFHNDQMRHEGVMEGIALQNAQSARIAAIAKMGERAGAQTAATVGTPTLQNASFDPGKVAVPAELTDPQERAAYIAAAGQAFHGAMLKGAIQQIAAAKNLRTSESQQTGMYDKILEAAQKVSHTPDNKAGDEQLLMQFQVGESPNVSPRTTQIEPLMKSLSTGRIDAAENWINRHTGGGLTDSEREQARDLTRQNATAQAESHMQHVRNVVTTGGFDLSNPEIMGSLVAAFHVSPETIKGLADGSLTPETAAKQAVDKVSPVTVGFGDIKSGGNKKQEGSW
ncbi:hypothetical protein [Citrobacter sp. Marseille-Q6884]|uniref:hypothetical protein n=1 Tax=Citrobacter sp. Marseille-Q6884 TaxID=2956786 RepID=UPI0021B31F1E|nr:hypothetical protein [Citrobacter sp. Marseille-Q6884]